MNFWVRFGNSELEQSMEVSDVAESEESKTKSKLKIMLIMFFNVGSNTASSCQRARRSIIVSKETMQCMIRSVHKKRRKLFSDKSWLLHHDNVPTHNGWSIGQFLAKRNIAFLEQCLCSSDLASRDIFFSTSTRGLILKARKPSRLP